MKFVRTTSITCMMMVAVLLLLLLEQYVGMYVLSSIMILFFLHRISLPQKILLFSWVCLVISSVLLVSVSLVGVLVTVSYFVVEVLKQFISSPRLRIVMVAVVMAVMLLVLSKVPVQLHMIWYTVLASGVGLWFVMQSWKRFSKHEELMIR